jgi:predicted nucleic acid-binding protein
MKNTTQTSKITTGEKVAIGTGITGLLVAATLGANFLFNTKKGKQSLKHIKSWAFKMKGEVLERLEKAKDISEVTYAQVIDELGEKYKKAKGMTVEEVAEIATELKGQWKKIHAEVKKTLKEADAKSKPKSKAVSKKVSTPKVK